MLGDMGSNTCFCLYGNALWMYAMVPVKYSSVGLWNRVAVGSVKRIECKKIFLFWGENSYLFPIFWPLSFLFSYFLSVICHLTPCPCLVHVIQHDFLKQSDAVSRRKGDC